MDASKTDIPEHFLRWDRPERALPGGGHLPFGVAFLRQTGSVWTIRDYTPENLMVLYLMTSNGRYTDADGYEGSLRPGTLMLRFPGRAHSMEFPARDDVAIATMGLSRRCCEHLVESGALSPEQPLLDVGLRLSVLARFDHLINELRVAPLVRLPLIGQHIQSFLVDLVVSARQEQNAPPGRQRIIQRACRILQADLDRRIALVDVADTLNVSYSWLRKAFQKEMGVAPGAWRIERRIERAMELLSQPDNPPKVVADRLGYPDVYAFSRQFKRFAGHPPGEFRRSLYPSS